jgi:predicted KAP-like P-loop ATPase
MDWISKILSRVKNVLQSSGTSDGNRVMHRSDRGAMSVPADNPIRKPEDDVLGRDKVARSFAEQVLMLDVSEGVVVGVLGPWGSGKTSFVNLVRVHLEDDSFAVLDFNPWMFSGAKQLVESFFIELAAQLKIRPELAEVGKDLEDYGETFSGLG